MDELAILNSIPTAEGAIQIAMEETHNYTWKPELCYWIRKGRAFTLARTLKAMGAEVTVVAPNPGQ